MASLQELNNKIASGVALSQGEQAEYFELIDEVIYDLKEREPKKYLNFLQEMVAVVMDLNKELLEI